MTNVVQLKPPTTQNTATPVPDFITRHDLEKMSDQQLDDLVLAIRARREAAQVLVEKTRGQVGAVDIASVKVKIEKKCEQAIKKIAKINDQLDDLERYVNELRGLRIQGGLELI